MFSALSQGSPIYLLDKTSAPKYLYLVGEIVGVSSPKANYSYGQSQNLVDLKVKIDDSIQEFNNLPCVNSVVTYNNGKIVISETRQGIQNEVENILQSSRNIIENIDTYKENITNCEEILKQLNPQFAKDKERDTRLSNLEEKFDSVESKLDKIFNLINK